MIKPIRFIPSQTHIPFSRFAPRALACSLTAVLLAVGLVCTIGLNLGIDFTGGVLVRASCQEGQSVEASSGTSLLRKVLSQAGLSSFSIQSVEGGDLIVKGGLDRSDATGTITNIRSAIEPHYKIKNAEMIGPQVSRELFVNGLLAVLVAVVFMMVYVWARFGWRFSVGATVALCHDVLVTVGALCLVRYEVGLPTVAAILTIVGYSMNDTIIVFDRIRQNNCSLPGRDLPLLIDEATNETLSRTAMTSFTTLLSLFALFLFGGEALASFTFTMIVGIIVGTYSSIFVASPVLLFVGQKSAGRSQKKGDNSSG